MRILFLDIDGVLNCEIFFQERMSKKQLRKEVKKGEKSREEYYGDMLCEERIAWLNDLCAAIGAKVVVSSTWRLGKTVEELQEILNRSGATFEIIGKTPHLNSDCVRGNEIYKWIKDNEEIIGCHYYEYRDYVILDDDSDMLLWQQKHFFQTDAYSGLTPNIVYKIKRHFGVNPYN